MMMTLADALRTRVDCTFSRMDTAICPPILQRPQGLGGSIVFISLCLCWYGVESSPVEWQIGFHSFIWSWIDGVNLAIQNESLVISIDSQNASSSEFNISFTTRGTDRNSSIDQSINELINHSFQKFMSDRLFWSSFDCTEAQILMGQPVEDEVWCGWVLQSYLKLLMWIFLCLAFYHACHSPWVSLNIAEEFNISFLMLMTPCKIFKFDWIKLGLAFLLWMFVWYCLPNCQFQIPISISIPNYAHSLLNLSFVATLPIWSHLSELWNLSNPLHMTNENPSPPLLFSRSHVHPPWWVVAMCWV